MNPIACKSCGTTTQRGPYCSDCEYMTPQDAQKRLHISPSKYYRMLQEGSIHQRKIGARKVLVSRAEIDSILSGQNF